MKKLLTISIIIIVSIYSCKKEDVAQPPPKQYSDIHFNLDTSIIHYKFKAGSYWVYKNDSTSVLDSIIVDSSMSYYNPISPYGPNHQGTVYSEFYSMFMKDYGTLQNYEDILNENYIIRYDTVSGVTVRSEKISCSNCDTGSVFGEMKILNKFTSMTINSNIFGNVVESKITAAFQQPPILFTNDIYFFYAPNFGLIKKEIDLGGGNIQSWSLLRWHVIR